jgi:HEPN domain-containing protein
MDIYEEWLEFAKEDLGISVIALGNDYYRSAIYDAQQCAEKSLKGYLMYKEVPLQKTHNLRILLQLCVDLDASFSEISFEVFEINGLDVKFRYPGESPFRADKALAELVVECSTKIFAFVASKCI